MKGREGVALGVESTKTITEGGHAAKWLGIQTGTYNMEEEWVFPVCSLPLRTIQSIRKTKTCLSMSTEHRSRLSISTIYIKPKNAKQKVKCDQKDVQVDDFS